jgi:phosphonoacetaldehyde hydrolase
MLTMQQVRSVTSLANYEQVRTLVELPAVADQFQIVHGRRWNEADVMELAADLVPQQIEAVGRHCSLVPDAVAGFEELRRRGTQIGTTTNYPREVAELIWDAIGLEGFGSDCDVCIDDVPAGRPAPWMIFRVMQQLDVFPPAGVLKVANSASGIEEGTNAGCWTAGMSGQTELLALIDTITDRLARGERP